MTRHFNVVSQNLELLYCHLLVSPDDILVEYAGVFKVCGHKRSRCKGPKKLPLKTARQLGRKVLTTRFALILPRRREGLPQFLPMAPSS